MSNYIIFTDSSSDIKSNILADWGVKYVSLTFRFSDAETEYKNDDMEIGQFYKKMTEGKVAKTAAVNAQTFVDEFESVLKEGNDILYIGFSSGLSTTFNSARLASEELKAKYPERTIVVKDSLAASAGLGLLVKLAVDLKNSGKTIEEVASFVDDTRLHISHWFTVDDLVYLKRGGRISPLVALVGNTFGIKPVLHVDNEGHLVSFSKSRGRRASINALADKFTETADRSKSEKVFISHAFCEEDAKTLARIIEEKHGVKTELITDVGPVIGAHSGPGTLALFFVGKER